MTEYVIAKYIRLSMDDAITESLSISNQQLQLDRQIDKMDIAGAQVLEFVQSGKIDCILCKDFQDLDVMLLKLASSLSRFSRFIKCGLSLLGILLILITILVTQVELMWHSNS